MFLRRNTLSLFTKVGRYLWPHMGWRRTAAYYWYRLHRIRGTSSFIAMGFACGVASALTPFYGLHIVTALLFAWALGGSGLAAAIGAFIANPWTQPALWLAEFYTGIWILGRDTATNPPNFLRVFKDLSEAMLTADGAMFIDAIWPVLWPMTVGGFPLAIIAGVAAYYILEPVMRRIQARRLLRVMTGKARDKVPQRAAGQGP